jgi:hypothetical protein
MRRQKTGRPVVFIGAGFTPAPLPIGGCGYLESLRLFARTRLL